MTGAIRQRGSWQKLDNKKVSRKGAKRAKENDLHQETIETCARVLDADADKQEEIWNDFIASGQDGPACSYHEITRGYAKRIRDLAIQ